MQRISLEDHNSNSHVTSARKTSATSSIASPSLSSSLSVSSGSSVASTASTASASKFQLLTTSKTIMENANNNINGNEVINSGSGQSNSMGEPIYAVVNLKNKYENRAKKKSIEEQCVCIENVQRRERPNSFHVNSGDYEEVFDLLIGFI